MEQCSCSRRAAERCGKRASRRMEDGITAGVRDHRQTADQKGGGLKVRASGAENKALTQAGQGPRECQSQMGFVLSSL